MNFVGMPAPAEPCGAGTNLLGSQPVFWLAAWVRGTFLRLGRDGAAWSGRGGGSGAAAVTIASGAPVLMGVVVAGI